MLTYSRGDVSTDQLYASNTLDSRLIVHRTTEGRACEYYLRHSQYVCLYRGRYVVVCGPNTVTKLANFLVH